MVKMLQRGFMNIFVTSLYKLHKETGDTKNGQQTTQVSQNETGHLNIPVVIQETASVLKRSRKRNLQAQLVSLENFHQHLQKMNTTLRRSFRENRDILPSSFCEALIPLTAEAVVKTVGKRKLQSNLSHEQRHTLRKSNLN